MLGDRSPSATHTSALNFDQPITPDATPDDGTPFAVVAAVSSPAGEQIEQVRTGDTFGLVLDLTPRRATPAAGGHRRARDELDQVAFATSTVRVRDDQAGAGPIPQLAEQETWRLRVWAEALLRQGQYRVRAVLRDPRTGGVIERTRDLNAP